jgi:hypothetical protein
MPFVNHSAKAAIDESSILQLKLEAIQLITGRNFNNPHMNTASGRWDTGQGDLHQPFLSRALAK